MELYPNSREPTMGGTPSKEEFGMSVSYRPEGYHSVTPYLVVRNVSGVMEFLKRTFDAEETFSMPRQDGTVSHAEMRVGDSMVMLGQPEGDFTPMPAMLYVYVEDVDATYRRAVEAGGTSLQDPEDQFYGDRTAGVVDSGGNQWYIATHVRDVSMEEMGSATAG